jgi:hypothetical protein
MVIQFSNYNKITIYKRNLELENIRRFLKKGALISIYDKP